MNPSFIPEIAQVLHEAVTMYLYPDVQHGLFSTLAGNSKSMLEDSPAWDFGIVHVEILTIVEEVKGNNYETFMSMNERDLEVFWHSVENQLKHISITNKRVVVHNRFLPLSKVPHFSLILTESYELLSTNHTAQRNDMYTHIRSDVFFNLLHTHKMEIWQEFGFNEIERESDKMTVGDVTVMPVFVYV